MYRPKGMREPEALAAAVARVEPMLGPEVARLRYDVHDNWSDQPAIYFKVLLTERSKEPTLGRIPY